MSSLLAVCPDARARVITLLMVQEGLRCCEVAGLEIQDIDWNEQLVLIKTSKGDNERVLPLSDETAEAITAYLKEQPSSCGPLVRSCLEPTSRISAKYVSRLVVGWVADAGLKGRPYDGLSAHALRHTAATDMLRSGAHLRDVQAALGHRNLQSTQVYLAWVVGDLRTAMGGRSYR